MLADVACLELVPSVQNLVSKKADLTVIYIAKSPLPDRRDRATYFSSLPCCIKIVNNEILNSSPL